MGILKSDDYVEKPISYDNFTQAQIQAQRLGGMSTLSGAPDVSGVKEDLRTHPIKIASATMAATGSTEFDVCTGSSTNNVRIVGVSAVGQTNPITTFYVTVTVDGAPAYVAYSATSLSAHTFYFPEPITLNVNGTSWISIYSAVAAGNILLDVIYQSEGTLTT